METHHKSKAVIIGILIVLAIVSGWLVFSGKGEAEEYVSLEKCFLRAPNTLYIPTTYVMGILIEDELLYRIIECESNFRPDICSYAGCDQGAGLCQIIPSTLKYCEEKLGRQLDVFNPEDNLACGIWLFENEGTSHWLPSRECWDK